MKTLPRLASFCHQIVQVCRQTWAQVRSCTISWWENHCSKKAPTLTSFLLLGSWSEHRFKYDEHTGSSSTLLLPRPSLKDATLEECFYGWSDPPALPWLRLLEPLLASGRLWLGIKNDFHGVLRGESDCSKLRMRNDCDPNDCSSEAHFFI